MKKLAAVSILIGLSSTSAFAGVDYQCLNDCTRRNYSYQYCEQVCTINAQQKPPVTVANPAGAFIEARRARQEQDRRNLDLEQMRIDVERSNQETERIKRQAAADAEREKAIEEARRKADREERYDRILKLNELRVAGAITDEEYESEKAKLLK